MIPWMIAESTQATVEILSGKIRYRWAAAITVVIKPETGPPRNPADRTPITQAFGSALSPDPDVIRDDAEDAEDHAEKHLFQESLPDTLPLPSSLPPSSFKRSLWTKVHLRHHEGEHYQ